MYLYAKPILAHVIQNQSTAVARACCALHATSRWAVSGTPIQNKLTDLASLITFLRVYPFSNPRTFDFEISKPLLRSEPQGFLKLKALVNHITLCRDNTVLDLPNRVDEIHRLDFNDAESKAYNAAKFRTASLLDTAIAADRTQGTTYLNALQWINALRLICNHGVIQSRANRIDITVVGAQNMNSWSSVAAQTAFESMICAGIAICARCSTDLATTSWTGATSNPLTPSCPELSECLVLLCGSCVLRAAANQATTVICTHESQCPTQKVTLQQPSNSFLAFHPTETPTKVMALLASLQMRKPGEKR